MNNYCPLRIEDCPVCRRTTPVRTVSPFASPVTKAPPGDAKLGKGDKVRFSAIGWVRGVNPDGSVDVAFTAEPFAEPDATRVPASVIVRLQAAPPEPRVGDEITGRQVRETPWQRGTVLRNTTPGVDDGDRYALLGTGDWVDMSADVVVGDGDALPTFGFAAFEDHETFVVELAPGKVAPN